MVAKVFSELKSFTTLKLLFRNCPQIPSICELSPHQTILSSSSSNRQRLSLCALFDGSYSINGSKLRRQATCNSRSLHNTDRSASKI